jgi:hypothetical protein
MRLHQSLGLALIFIGPFCLAQSAPAGCLSYEPAVVQITGTLVRRTYPGPPNYESIRKGDKAETYWLISLDSTACVNENKAKSEPNLEQSNIKNIQLVFDAVECRHCRSLEDKKVIGTGTLFGAHTGHHHTPVLMTVDRLQRAQIDRSE